MVTSRLLLALDSVDVYNVRMYSGSRSFGCGPSVDSDAQVSIKRRRRSCICECAVTSFYCPMPKKEKQQPLVQGERMHGRATRSLKLSSFPELTTLSSPHLDSVPRSPFFALDGRILATEGDSYSGASGTRSCERRPRQS